MISMSNYRISEYAVTLLVYFRPTRTTKDRVHLTLGGHQGVARGANGTCDPIP
jgi:hypothetical protein